MSLIPKRSMDKYLLSLFESIISDGCVSSCDKALNTVEST